MFLLGRDLENYKMGLDVSHGCYGGGYGTFNFWRDELARTAGYSFKLYEGSYYREAPVIDWDGLDDKNLNGDWDEDPNDPLVILIAHYDTEGFIRHKHTKILADRLKELFPKLPEYNETLLTRHINNRMRELTTNFINGLILAHDFGEDVKFS